MRTNASVRPLGQFFFAVASGFTACSAEYSFGQIGYDLSSLEWLVADADVVVVAAVVEVAREPGDEHWDWSIVTVDVRETVKGAEAVRLTFVVSTLRSDESLERWSGSGRDVLCFLRRSNSDNRDRATSIDERRSNVLDAHDTDLFANAVQWSLIPLDLPESEAREPPPPIFTINLRLLETGGEILDAARLAVAGDRDRQQQLHRHEVYLPPAIAQRTGASGDRNRFLVPVDYRLEILARRMIESPEDFLTEIEESRSNDDPDDWPRRERGLLRAEGVRALEHFKSEENVALLTELLHDVPLYDEIREQAKRDRLYDFRERTYEVLEKWGVPFERVVREGLDRED